MKDTPWNFIKGGAYGRYLPTGHLVYGYNGKLMAAAMDLAGQRIIGEAVQVLDGVMMNHATGSVQFDVSHTGDLVYVPGGLFKRFDSLVLVDRKTGSRKSIEPPRGGAEMLPLDSPNVSPSGQQIAVRVGKGNDDIYVHDLKDKTFRRITLEGGDKLSPLWIPPDGKRFAYATKAMSSLRYYLGYECGSTCVGSTTTTVLGIRHIRTGTITIR